MRVTDISFPTRLAKVERGAVKTWMPATDAGTTEGVSKILAQAALALRTARNRWNKSQQTAIEQIDVFDPLSAIRQRDRSNAFQRYILDWTRLFRRTVEDRTRHRRGQSSPMACRSPAKMAVTRACWQEPVS